MQKWMDKRVPEVEVEALGNELTSARAFSQTF
jgi:hypothetical protein